MVTGTFDCNYCTVLIQLLSYVLAFVVNSKAVDDDEDDEVEGDTVVVVVVVVDDDVVAFVIIRG